MTAISHTARSQHLRDEPDFKSAIPLGERPTLVYMPSRGSYTGYSIGCATVWAAILIAVKAACPDRLHVFLPVCGGWAAGWLSATIARSVYPPPSRS